jgi:cleavage stimulation factor subunit 2
LNGVDVGGRPLRIDLADSDPFLEGKTTVRGEIIDGGGQGGWSREGPARRADPNAFLRDLPAGVPVPPGGNALDAITHNLATMNPSQLIEVLAQMKVYGSIVRSTQRTLF